MEYESDNDMVGIIQPTKKAKGKLNEIIDELIWTQAAKDSRISPNRCTHTMQIELWIIC